MLPMQNYSGFFGASAMQQFVSTVPLVSAPIASGAVLSTSPTPAGSAASTPFPTPVPTPTANSVAKMGRTMFPGEAQFSTSEEVAETAVVKEQSMPVLILDTSATNGDVMSCSSTAICS